MAEEAKKKGGNKDSIRIILVIALIIVAAGAGYKIYTDGIAKEQLQAEFDQTKTILTTKLDSISGQLSNRISEIARLGGNIDSLVTLKDSITAERDQLQRTRTANKAIIQRLDRKVTGYEELLLAKDDEIAALKVINTQLLEENTDLKVEKNELNATIREANQTKQQLEQKISLAAKLKAENIKVYNINSRGKEREGDFRSRQAEKIKVTFNLSENAVAPVAGHKIMIQIVDPAGNVVFDIARGSGSFQVDGREQFYTAMQEILFDNSKQELSFVYDKGSEFDKGDYKINIISDFYEIGQAGFSVR
ncbi:MAG: chromosome segregation protein SMC [Cytophagales bacterium CG12_big_fil_rev_8_21_14_0_65_40_12]|nr:MAG: chromosome segregation protein SMC [Cytophagales bacterium CG12_big_fil_rev_8_21_14_0_65_40_12]PIW05554.1 MAG: chromosome segregation protein SMC [Cytophagales bacterium CG17_big_fil_post_rev_8_21_14_2_50_40_13]